MQANKVVVWWCEKEPQHVAGKIGTNRFQSTEIGTWEKRNSSNVTHILVKVVYRIFVRYIEHRIMYGIPYHKIR